MTSRKRPEPLTLYDAAAPLALAWWRFIWRLMDTLTVVVSFVVIALEWLLNHPRED